MMQRRRVCGRRAVPDDVRRVRVLPRNRSRMNIVTAITATTISAVETSSTKDRLLEAAEELFAAQGFDGVSVDDITRRAKANRAAVSFHFGGKERLYIEAVKYAHRNCVQRRPVPRMAGRHAGGRAAPRVHPHHDGPHDDRPLAGVGPADDAGNGRSRRPRARRWCRNTSGRWPTCWSASSTRCCRRTCRRPRRYLLGFSIVAQCLFYRTHRPIAALLMGEDEFRRLDVETLTEHVTAASLAMIEGAMDCERSARRAAKRKAVWP